jgi:cytoskeleton protein RodZ
LGLELGEIAAALRIKASHLQAIEDGDYGEVPGQSYAIGFIRTYAEYLGLDGPDMVRRFKQQTEGQGLKHDLSFPLLVSERRVPRSSILLGTVIIAVCGYGIWHYGSSDDQDRTERVAAVPSTLLVPPPDSAIAPTAVKEPTASVAALPVQSGPSPPAPIRTPSESSVSRSLELAHAQREAPTPAPTNDLTAPAVPATSPQPAPAPTAGPPVDPGHVFGVTDSAPSRIALRATDDTWLEVKDGKVVIFRRLMRAGDEYRLADKPGLTMRVGNTRGIEVTIDGKPLPSPVAADLLRHVAVNLDAQELLAHAGTQ